MSSSFTVRSAEGILVSLLNPVDISPMDFLHHDQRSSCDESSQARAVKIRRTCTVCSRTFSSASHLNRHLTVHTGERKHICPFLGCGRTASRSDNLVQHYRLHLPENERDQGTTHLRFRLEEKIDEISGWAVQCPGGPKVVQAPAHPVLIFDPELTPSLTPQSPRDSLSSDTITSPLSAFAYERPLADPGGSTMSSFPSRPVLTPPFPLPSSYAERQGVLFDLHLGFYRDGPQAYQPSTGAIDNSSKLFVANAGQE